MGISKTLLMLYIYLLLWRVKNYSTHLEVIEVTLFRPLHAFGGIIERLYL